MASTYTTVLGLELQANGENDNTWGTKANTVFEMLEDAFCESYTITTTGGTTTLNMPDGSTSLAEARNLYYRITGTLVSNATITVPDGTKKHYIINNVSNMGSFTITFKTVSGTGVSLSSGISQVYADGTNVIPVSQSFNTYAETLLGATSANAARTVLGLGTVAVEDIGTSGDTIGKLNTPNTWSAAQTISSTSVGTLLTVSYTDAGASLGPTISLNRSSPTPSVDDTLGRIAYLGKNADDVSTVYADIAAQIDSTATGSEDGRLLLRTAINGSLQSVATLKSGIVLSDATGGDQGDGTLNAKGIFINGTELPIADYYESSNQTISNAGGLIELSHGLGGVPKQFQVILRCITTDMGYSAGDEIDFHTVYPFGTGAAYNGVIGANSTQLFIRYSNNFIVLNKDTGAYGAITFSSWRFVLKAWR